MLYLPLLNSLLHIKDDKFLIISINCFFFQAKSITNGYSSQSSHRASTDSEGRESKRPRVTLEPVKPKVQATQQQQISQKQQQEAQQQAQLRQQLQQAAQAQLQNQLSEEDLEEVLEPQPDQMGLEVCNAFACDNIKELFAPSLDPRDPTP